MLNRAGLWFVLKLAGGLAIAGCRDAGDEARPTASDSARTEVLGDSTPDLQVAERSEPELPADCLVEKDYRDWLFLPSAEPIAASPINTRNSAKRVHRLRDRIVRVEVAHEYTRRTLFELSDSGVVALRELPKWPPLQLRDHGLPPGKDWPVVFLIHVDGEELPYVGHPHNNELWFAEDENPWGFYVWTDSGKARKIHPIPFGDGVYSALEEKLGRPDPGGMRAAEAKNQEDIRCGRARPTVPERPRPFPEIPRATVEAAG